MNKKLIDWWAGGATNSYYQAVLDRATTLAYTKPTAQRTAQNNLATAFDTNGIFSTHDVIHIFAANNAGVENFAYLNWKTPASFEVTKAGSALPTYGVGGFDPGTGTGYLLSNFNPSSQGTTWVDASSCSITIWIVTYPSISSDYVCTTGGATARNFIVKSSGTAINSVLHTNPEGTISTTTGTEAAYDVITHSVYGGNLYVFKNGSQIRTAAATLGTSASSVIFYMRSLIAGHPNSMVMGAVLIGGGITLAQHTAIHSALSSYKTAIGL